MKLSSETSGKGLMLIVESDLTIEYAGGLKEELTVSLDTAGDIHVVFEEVHNVDLSGIQLICAAGRSAAAQKRKMTIGGRSLGVFMKALDDAGISGFTEFVIEGVGSSPSGRGQGHG